MESSRLRGRKRYCCFYCNTYFYQVDTWQRHNRKHTGVEIECDDCGEMFSDHFELKAHQQLCMAYRVYSEEVYTQAPSETHQHVNRPNSSGERGNENSSVHETPDSTSKQESLPENDDCVEDSGVTVPIANEEYTYKKSHTHTTNKNKEKEQKDIVDKDENSAKASELDYLIGEDPAQSDNNMQDEDDLDTDAMIGIDQREVRHMKNIENESKQSDGNVGVDTHVVIKVDSALNSLKQSHVQTLEGKEHSEAPTFYNRPSPLGTSVTAQCISLDSADMSKKYQPYFCKNCGARFTRKDSVTRHLKKGTCSGKSAIVCNVCGKVFSEMFELQRHFKSEHKNLALTPSIVHRSLLPRIENHEQPYAHYPPHYVVNEQHINRVSRPFIPPEQTYRPMPPGLQTMFYGNQASFTTRTTPTPGAGHYCEQVVQPRAVELTYSPINHVGKDIRHVGKDVMFMNNPGKLASPDGELNRKREYLNSKSTEMPHEDVEVLRKSRKLNSKYPPKHYQPTHIEKYEPKNHEINLSEYTNNAMKASQYYGSRFSKREHVATGEDEPHQIHQCKVCGLEFPRFEYLLTHLRKHKEKNEITDVPEDHVKDQLLHLSQSNATKDDSNHHNAGEGRLTTATLNDSNSCSSDDNNEVQPKVKFVVSQINESQHASYSAPHEPVPVPVVIQSPRSRYSIPQPTERYLSPLDQMYASQTPLIPTSTIASDGSVETLTPGVDGKFRPFICENCGQRFTRKDSLVRHAKKQTCFEELVDLKCKQCDKTFRYHKCLIQHQELVHGIPQDEQKPNNSEDEQSDSDKSENPEFDVEEKKRQSCEPKYPGEKYHIQRNLDKIIDKPEFNANQTPSQYHPFVRDSHYPSQAPPTNQLGPNLKVTPPTLSENIKSQETNSQSSNQESQYIGYCMLPRPFQCEYCGDRFAHRHSLKRHVRRHLGIGIPCHDCGKLYRDQSEWRRHQRSIHNRNFEKYEVPNRMSFRDGVEQGLIGIVPSADYETHLDHEESEKSDSERSDDDLSMAKSRIKYSNVSDREGSKSPSEGILDGRRVNNLGSNKEAQKEREDENMADMKEERLQSFDFKSHSAGDKDTRKSLLDLYLRSPSSDDGGDPEKSADQV